MKRITSTWRSGDNLLALAEESDWDIAAIDYLERSDFAMVIESLALAMYALNTTSASRLVSARCRVRGAGNWSG